MGEGKGTGKVVMVKGKAEKFGGDRVSFDMIELGKTGDKESKIFGLVVFDSKVIYHQDEGDDAG
jgi:hypothetical protein